MKVQVWNDNVYPFEQEFRGKLIHIPSKDCIEMEESDALSFKGRYFPIVKTPAGGPDPKFFKMIRIEKEFTAPTKVEPEFTCQFDGSSHASAEALAAYTKEKFGDKILTDREIQETKSRKKSKEYDT